MATPTIKILVSCHKDFLVPPCNLYLPVQLGAFKTDDRFTGMQPDNEGENISERNFTYCEMSAQYWAWKNLDADYVGQCHYRRYFYFSGKHKHANDHAQIEVPLMCHEAVNEYRLSDEYLMRTTIEDVDAILPPQWSVIGVPTPHGAKRTIRDHMVAYELMDYETLNLMESIVAEKAPEYSEAVRKYLNGHKYTGYNCFVLRRDLFDKLCAFEFAVLQEFDARFDYTDRTPTQMRICGYLGEILFSSFAATLRKDKSLTIKEVPLTFFQNVPVKEREGDLTTLPTQDQLKDAYPVKKQRRDLLQPLRRAYHAVRG